MIFLSGDEFSEQIVGQFGWTALYAFVGFIIVILALIVLVLILTVLPKLINIKLPARKKSNENGVDAQPKAADGDESIVAAVSAALSVIYAGENAGQAAAGGSEAVPPPPFIIKSIRKI